MLILFVRHGAAFLPEIDAYTNFFAGMGIDCEQSNAPDSSRKRPDVAWHIMGMDTAAPGQGVCRIHDYASASVPPLRRTKDLLKKWINAKPDYRLYLNEYVKLQFGFEDNVPFGFRDMGISLGEKNGANEKEYDFIYVGEVNSARGFKRWIKLFTQGPFRERSLLIVSKSYQCAALALANFSNIKFVGPVPTGEVRNLVKKSRFALNFVPDLEPFSAQTSTKLLEYADAAVPIISTDYRWVREFQCTHGGNFYYVNSDFSNLTWEAVNQFDYHFPDLQQYLWDTQIHKSGVVDFLQSRFPDEFKLKHN